MNCYATKEDELQQILKKTDTTTTTTTSKQGLIIMSGSSITTTTTPPYITVQPNDDAEPYVNIDMVDQPDTIIRVVSPASNGGGVNLGAVTDAIKQMKTEVLEDHACSPEKKMMSLELLLNGADAESDDPDKDSNVIMSPPSDDQGSRSSQSESERCLVPIECGTPPSATCAPQPVRPPCAICRSENGRCHASDPLSMQSFFVTSLNYEGILSSADWLCMKCYSKWYNRCKRKASAANSTLLNDAQAVPSATPNGTSTPTPPRRKRVRDTKEKEKRKHRIKERPVPQIEAQPEPEPELLDHDTDSDDALLLTRMTLNNYHNHHHSFHTLSNSYNGAAVHQTDNPSHAQMHNAVRRDLEMEVDELHSELHRVRGEMMRLAQELSRRDEQMEGMLKFVKTEMAAMHGLLKDIADVRWRAINTSPPIPPSAVVHHHQQPHVQTNGHIFHLNGKILDNGSPHQYPPTPTALAPIPPAHTAEVNGNNPQLSRVVPRPQHALMHAHPPSNEVVV